MKASNYAASVLLVALLVGGATPAAAVNGAHLVREMRPGTDGAEPTSWQWDRTAQQPACPGDCNVDGAVTVDELTVSVAISLGIFSASSCEVADVNGDNEVSIDEILLAVNRALDGCEPIATPTSSPTPAATSTPAPGSCGFACDGRACEGICPDGSPRLGSCSGNDTEGCRCELFECPVSCGITLDALPATWDKLSITLTGTLPFVGYQQIYASIEGGVEPVPVTFTPFHPYSVEVTLTPGLNHLRIVARASGPPGCHSEIDADILVVLPTPEV